MTVTPLQILHLEDNALDAELVAYALKSAELNCQVDWVDNFAAFELALQQQDYALILADYTLPDCDGLKALAAAQRLNPQTPFLLVTGTLGEERAIDIIKAGVTDYVLKTNLSRLRMAIPRALAETRNRWEKQSALEALRLSEERFELAVCGAGAGIWDWPEVASEAMWWSPRIYEILGYADAEFPATRGQLFTLAHPDDVEIARLAMHRHLTEGQPYDTEFRLQHKLGHYVWVRSRGKSLATAGKPQRMAGYVQDVSGRKLAQENLRAREADLLRAQQVAHIGSWYLDIGRNQLRWTAETYKIFGFQDEAEFSGTYEAFLACVHPADRDYVVQRWNAALQGEHYDIEHRILLQNGAVRHVREVAEVEFDKQRRPLRAVGVVHDLTEKRLSEHEQRQADERYRVITTVAQEAIVMLNAAGRVTFWNPAAEKIFGFSAAEMLGQEVHQLLAPESSWPQASKGIKHFAATGEGTAVGSMFEFEGLTKQGKLIPLEMTLSGVYQDGEWQAIGVLRDISERRQADDDKQELEQQLRQTQKMEAIGTLAGGIAHDFNNILAAILGYTALVERRLAEGSREKHDLQEVLKAAERAKQLVYQILTFSRKSEQLQQPVYLDLVIKEVLQLIRASLPASIELDVRLQAGGEAILGDSTQLHQVLMNLCTNASHAMPKGGTLTVVLKNVPIAADDLPELLPGDYLELQVSDTGSGIDMAIIDKIFDPYFTTKELGTGTGLGLSVVRGIVTGLSGSIEVESEPGAGTCFRLLFPIYHEQAVVEPELMPESSELKGGSEHILLVDDEVSLLELSEDVLTDLGYRVTTSTSSLAALQLVEAAPQGYDLVITDQTMPQMTGIELAKQLKRIAPQLPVILSSGLPYSLQSEGVEGTAICGTLLKTQLIDSLPQLLKEILGG